MKKNSQLLQLNHYFTSTFLGIFLFFFLFITGLPAFGGLTNGEGIIFFTIIDKTKKSFSLSSEGTYDIWVKPIGEVTGDILEIVLKKKTIQVEGKIVPHRWTNLFSGDLKTGPQSLQILFHKQNRIANRSKKKISDKFDVIIVDKKLRQKYEKKLETKDIDYLFSRIENNQKTHTFYTLKDSIFNLKAVITQKRVYKPEYTITNTVMKSLVSVNPKEDFNKWKISSIQNISESDYDIKKVKKGLNITVRLKKFAGIKEELSFEKTLNTKVVSDNKYLLINCSIEDSAVQNGFAEVWLKDKFENLLDEKITFDDMCKSKLFLNIYEKVKKRFGKAKTKNLSIGKIKITLKKNIWIDASVTPTIGTYSFTLMQVDLVKEKPILAVYKNNLKNLLIGRYYYYDIKGEFKWALSQKDIPEYVEDIYTISKKNHIDLKKHPLLPLSFSNPYKNILTSTPGFAYTMVVSLFIDFNGDHVSDATVDVESRVAPLGSSPYMNTSEYNEARSLMRGDLISSLLPAQAEGDLLHTRVKAYKEIKKRYPDKKAYILTGIRIKKDKKLNFYMYQELSSVNMTVSHKQISPLSEFSKSDLFFLDGKKYSSDTITPDSANNRLIAPLKSLLLKKGNHSLTLLEGKKFQTEMVYFYTEGNSEIEYTPENGQDISYEKVNPTKYIGDITIPEKPITLVFSESFHSGWRAFLRIKRPNIKRSGEWSVLWDFYNKKEEKIELTNQVLINGYANGWIFDPAIITDKTVSYEIVIVYEPQKIFEIGTLVSSVTAIGCVFYLLVVTIINRKEKMPS